MFDHSDLTDEQRKVNEIIESILADLRKSATGPRTCGPIDSNELVGKGVAIDGGPYPKLPPIFRNDDRKT